MRHGIGAAACDDGRDHSELNDMTRRFWVSAALTAPLLVLMFFGFPARRWIELALATPVVLWGGWPFFRARLGFARQSQPEHVHADRARYGSSLPISLVARWLPGAFPESFRIMGERCRVYFEPAAVIIVLVLLGQVLELRARSRTSSALRSLLGLAPKTARVVSEIGQRTRRFRSSTSGWRLAARSAR